MADYRLITEEFEDWTVWETRPGGPSVTSLLTETDDEEAWAQRRAAAIRAEGGTAVVKRRMRVMVIGPWIEVPDAD